MLTRQEFRLYLIVAAVALLSWGLVQWNEERDVQIKIAENSPDFFSSGYYKKQMDSEGLPKNELLADKMLHYNADGSTHLEKPIMTLYGANRQSPWVIKAESGIMAADGDNLQLNGKTFINREPSKGVTALTVNTSDLRVKLSSNYAETSAWAEIISPPNKTSGTGMEVTFVSPVHLKLLAKVKGRYELDK
ncbi:MAG: LPS export ABC transporter periplasmic protein LptC [Methylococcaceae bacterium]|nr:LPS export ABC transporter periplasmic protein LptC [Methylococcaceae bacterium]